MVSLAPWRHDVRVSGDDPAAKGRSSSTGCATWVGEHRRPVHFRRPRQEMYLALWVRTMVLGTPAFTMAIAMPDGTAAVTPAGPASDPTTRD